MTLSYELSTRLADSSLEYVAGQIRVALGLQGSLADSVANVYQPKNYTAGGAPLTTVNFEAALQATVDAAFAVSTSVKASPVILIPDGVWPMTAPVRLKSRGYDVGAAWLVCAAKNSARLVWPSTYHGRCVWLDGAHNGATYYYYGGLLNVAIEAQGTGCELIYAEQLIFTELKSVLGIGVNSGSYTVAGRSGSAASCAAAVNGAQTLTGLANMSQDDVDHEIAIGGGATGANNATSLIVQYISPTSVKVFNASGTSDANNGALTWQVKRRCLGVHTRGDITNAQGFAITNNQNVIASDCVMQSCQTPWALESWLGGSINDGVGNQSGGYDVILGHNVSLKWRGGMLQSGGAYTVFVRPGGSGGVDFDIADIHHEGPATSFFKSFLPTAGVAPILKATRVAWNEYSPFADASGARSVEIEEPIGPQPTTIVTAVNTWRVSVHGGNVEPYLTTWSDNTARYVLDDISRNGFECVGRHVPWRAHSCTEKNLNALLLRRGIAAEIWDPSIAANLTVAGGNLQAAVGVNGRSLGPQNAALYPTFQASNSAFGGRPTWTNLAGAAAACGALTGTLTTTQLPVGSRPGLLVVYRLPVTTAATGARRVFWTDGTSTVAVGAADNVNAGHYGRGTPNPGVVAAKSVTVTPECMLAARGCYYPSDIGAPGFHVYMSDAAGGGNDPAMLSVAGGTVTVFGTEGGAAILATEIAYVAVLKRSPTYGEREAILDLCATQWPGIARL